MSKRRRRPTLAAREQGDLVLGQFAEIDDLKELVDAIKHSGIELGTDVMMASEDILAHYKVAGGYDWLRCSRDLKSFPPFARRMSRGTSAGFRVWLAEELQKVGGGASATRAGRVAPAMNKCGARTKRSGRPCQRPGSGAGGRCRHHGGHSMGLATPEGRESIGAFQRARWAAWRVKDPPSVHRPIAAARAPPSRPLPRRADGPIGGGRSARERKLQRHAELEAINRLAVELIEANGVRGEWLEGRWRWPRRTP
jgi:hypothetical protein